MKKNNFFMVLFSAVVLSGISFEAHGMENKNLIIGAGIGTAVLIATTLLIKNTATYKAYDKHNARLLEEKEKSENPYLYAQPLPTTGQPQQGSGNKRADAFLKQYEEQRLVSLQQTKTYDSWDGKKIIDSYDPIFEDKK